MMQHFKDAKYWIAHWKKECIDNTGEISNKVMYMFVKVLNQWKTIHFHNYTRDVKLNGNNYLAHIV
jgi:hypothetical protein